VSWSAHASASGPSRLRRARRFPSQSREWEAPRIGNDAGSGFVQRWGGLIEPAHPGDVVGIAPNEKHWHGASPTVPMTRIAIQESLKGKAADWLERVSEEQYGGRVAEGENA
jgi:hypothetical protein